MLKRYDYPYIHYKLRTKGHFFIFANLALLGFIMGTHFGAWLFYLLSVLCMVQAITVYYSIYYIWPDKAFFEISEKGFKQYIPFLLSSNTISDNRKFTEIKSIKKIYWLRGSQKRYPLPIGEYDKLKKSVYWSYLLKHEPYPIFQYHVHGEPERYKRFIHLPCELIEADLKSAFGELWNEVYKPDG